MKHIFTFFMALALCFPALAEKKDSTEEINFEELAAFIQMRDSIESTLHYQTGTIALESNGTKLGMLTVPQGFKFLNGDEADYVLTDLWGNEKGGAKPLGMLVSEGGVWKGWAFEISYDQVGHIKDDDVDDINYTEMLEEIKKDIDAQNISRAAQNLSKISLIGWAAQPFYDKDKKILHWAKEFKFEGDEENTLNYDIRILTRKGMLVFKAISSMKELAEVNKNLDGIISSVNIESGQQYKDFDPDIDEVAAWTVGGLVAGKLLAKAGILAGILKFGKVIVLGLLAAGGAIWRFLTGRKKAAAAVSPTDNSANPS